MFDGPNTPLRHVDVAIPDASWARDEPALTAGATAPGDTPRTPQVPAGLPGSTEAYLYFRTMVLRELSLSEQEVKDMGAAQRERLDAVIEPEIQDRMMAALLAEAGAPVQPSIENRSRTFKNAYDGLGELDVFLDVFGDGRVSLAFADRR